MKFINSVLIVLAGTVITLLPTELWFLIWWLVKPFGFWQKVLIAGGGIWTCGVFQVIFLTIGGTLTFIFVSEYLQDTKRRPPAGK